MPDIQRAIRELESAKDALDDSIHTARSVIDDAESQVAKLETERMNDKIGPDMGVAHAVGRLLSLLPASADGGMREVNAAFDEITRRLGCNAGLTPREYVERVFGIVA